MTIEPIKEQLMNSFFRAIRTLALVISSLAFLAGTSTFAQTFRGTILGSVTDTSGAAVPGATVTVKNADTGLVRTVTTSEDGSYAAPELPIGTYSVSVEKAGFKLGVVTGIKVEVSSERRADVTLQPGQLAQTVEVLGEELPQVESTSNTLGGIVESKVVTSLPVNGRDYQKLIFLVPGVTGSPDQITDSPGSFGIFSVNGARGRANNFLLDGTDMNDGYRNDPAINEAGTYGTPATILPVEAIAELRVASNFESEYGRSAGGVINVVTKSGTNQIHGSGFEFFRNTALDARNYFNPATNQPGGQPQEPFHNNQFGGSLGGPIFRDKTFFFIDYEGVRETGKLNYTTLVPTQQEISQATADITASGGTLSPVITKLLALNPWPSANLPSTAFSGVNNAFVATPFSNRVDNGIIKIDHNFNKDNLLTGRYYIGDSDQSFPLGLVGGSLLPGYNVITPTRVQLVALSYVSVLSPDVVNEARLGWNRFAEGFFPQDRSFNPNSAIGLNTGVVSYNDGLPRINVGSYAQIGANYTVPRQRVDTNWHYIDNVSWKRGKHDIKAGYEFRRTSISQILNIDFRGRLAFSGTPAAGTFCGMQAAPSLCESLELFLAGTPSGGSIASGSTDRNTFQNSHALYFQDSYRMSRNLTLNLGLRYDYYGLIQEKHGNFTNVLLDPATQLATTTLIGQGRLYQPDYKNAAPRVSIAWDVTGRQKTVVRAGYGIFYDAFSQDGFIGQVPYNSLFDPGNAYAGFGPNPISFASASSGQIQPGVRVYGAPSPMSDGFGVDPNLRTPYMQNFNLNLQQELGHRMVLQVGYVGSNGHRLLRTIDANQPTQAMITAADCAGVALPAPGQPCPGGKIQDGSVPRFYTNTNLPYNFFYLNYLQSASNSNYNSLQTSFRINDWHGLTSTINYTWSHSIDDASDLWEYITNGSTPNQTYTPHSNRGNSNFDVRNRIAWNFVYSIPDAKESRFKIIRNGWGLNGILTIQAGQPFQFNYNFEDDYDGSGSFYGVPDRIGPVHYNQSDPNNYINLNAFAVPCTPVASGFDGTASSCLPGTRHFGTLGRNSLVGPHFRQFDFSVFKNTSITERLKMELRFEAYNLLNHPNFANPYLPFFVADPSLNGATPAGVYKGSYALTATGDVGIGYPFLGSGGPRSLQIAAKFTF